MLPTGILVVSYNSAAHIAACLDAIAAKRGPTDRVLVIDNNSSDGTAAIARAYEDVSVLANSENLGFAAAVNQGFRHFGSTVGQVLLLNPDVILEARITELEQACQQFGLAAGCLLEQGGGPQRGFSIRRFATPAALLCETLGINRLFPSNPVNCSYRYLDFDYTKPGFAEQPAGALLMIRRDVWTALGGFDEQFYPVWFEDADFCKRAAVAGFRAAYLPSMQAVHAGGHSVNQVPESQRRLCWYASLLRYSRKHFRGLGQRLVSAGVIIAGLARAAASSFGLRIDAARTWIQVARLGFVYFTSRHAISSLSTNHSAWQGRPADAAHGRGSGGVVDSSAINNTERSLKRLHAR
jgi:N-acetylglucosaminyl-diphospho-decaprenol L-rhamnosyltransferase